MRRQSEPGRAGRAETSTGRPSWSRGRLGSAFGALVVAASFAPSDAAGDPLIVISSTPELPSSGGSGSAGNGFQTCPEVIFCSQLAPTTDAVAVPETSFSPGAAASFNFPAALPVPGTITAATLPSADLNVNTLAPGTLTPTPAPTCLACTRTDTPPGPTTSPTPTSTVPRAPGAPDGDNRGPANQTGSDPVNFANGEFVVHATDLELPGRGVAFRLVRTYRSRIDYSGPLGFGWTHTYDRRITLAATGGDDRNYSLGDGTTILFRSDGHGGFVPPAGVRMSLGRTSDGWRLVDVEANTILTFDGAGRLARMADGSGVGLTFGYEAGKLDHVDDAEGRRIQCEYDGNRLKHVFEARTGLGASYTYVADELDTATNSAGRLESYRYTAAAPNAPSPPRGSGLGDLHPVVVRRRVRRRLPQPGRRSGPGRLVQVAAGPVRFELPAAVSQRLQGHL